MAATSIKQRATSIFARLGIVFALVVGLFGSLPAGPVHAATTLTVTNTNDSGAGSLRDAISRAVSGDTIIFQSGLSGGTITFQSQMTISAAIAIDGSSLAVPITLNGGGNAVFSTYSGGGITLKNLTITNSSHGAIYNSGMLTIVNSTFSGNSTDNDYAGGAVTSRGLLTIRNSTFVNNNYTSTWGTPGGGAIFNNSDGTLILANNTFTGNTAPDNKAGALYNMGPATLTNNTIAGNTGGIVNGADPFGQGGTLNLINNIIAKNGGTDCAMLGGTPGTNVNNLITAPSACGYPISTSDPKLGPLADNGGPTQTIALDAGSAAIDAGNDAACTASDQRGVARPTGAHCDVGAFEAGATPAAPEVSLAAVTSITAAGATLNGSANAHDGLTFVAFDYGETNAYGERVTPTQSPLSGHTDTPVSVAISGLKANTVYHYRITVANSEGSVQTGDATFTTAKAAPTLVAQLASAVTTTTATLNGEVSPRYDSVAVAFEYGETTAYGLTTPATPGSLSGGGVTPVAAALTGLHPNTTYHIRVVAQNATGEISRGLDVTFTTSPVSLFTVWLPLCQR